MSDAKTALNVVFAGTPEFAKHHLDALLKSRHNIVGVYTQPDRPKGRGKKLAASPVKELAEQHDIPVYQPVSLRKQEAQAELANLEYDLMIVVAYGLFLPQKVLDLPRLGCLNVHGSILPRWRGAAPIQRAIELGDSHSGVTIMQMEAGLDTGPMLLKRECDIGETDTSAALHDRLAEIGPQALLDCLDLIIDGKAEPEIQNDDESNYADKIEKAEAEINWCENLCVIDRKIRAFNPFPICYSTLNGDRVKVYQASKYDDKVDQGKEGLTSIEQGKVVVQCGDGRLALDVLQIPGKKAMDCTAFLNGFSQLLNSPEGGYVTLGSK